MVSLKANRPYVPMIQYLCTEGIKDRHWNEIYDILGFDEQYRNEFLQDGVKDYKDVMKISDIKGRLLTDANSILPKLEEISTTASQEFKYENMLKNMKNDWGPAEFGCKVYKDTFILDGEAIDLIQTLLDDHIIKTQTMKGSPYARHILAECLQWEQDLMATQDYLEIWLKVQSKWLYLEPVFSSEDI